MSTPAETSPAPIWFLRNSALFEEQTESLLESVAVHARPIEFQRNDSLMVVEDVQKYIFSILEGQVKLRSLTEGGKEIILDIMGPGDAFGPIDRVLKTVAPTRPDSPGALPTEAIALSKGRALRYDFNYFQDLVARRPAVVVNLTKLLGLRQRRLEIRLTRLLYRSSLGKVAGLLSELGERYGQKTPDGEIRLDLRITHQEMASIVGAKRETVSESLAELEYQGLIRTEKSRLHLIKTEELDRIQ